MSDKSITNLESRLTRLLEQYNARQDTNGVRFALAAPKRGWRWEWSSPGSSEQYFIASTTKLYVTALVMQLRAAGQLDLEAPAARYLAPSVMTGIHVLRGVDAAGRITIRELLSHTSGIADYFEQRQRDGSTQIGKALQADFAWTFDDVLRITKEELTPRFAPSTPGKAFYSDTNYQLLGAVIEAVTGDSYEDALRQRVLEPLALPGTYPFTLDTLGRYDSVAAMLYGKRRVAFPRAMASVRADGGMVSTAGDGLTFLEAFMTDRLFPRVPGRDAEPMARDLCAAAVRHGPDAVCSPALLHAIQRGPAHDRALGGFRGCAFLRPGAGPLCFGNREPDQEAEPLVQLADTARHGVPGGLAVMCTPRPVMTVFLSLLGRRPEPPRSA